MLRIFGNIVRTTAYLCVAGLVGFYNFEKNGWLGVSTNLAFLIIGVLLVATWRSPTRKRFGPNSDAPSSSATATGVVVVAKPDEIDREATNTATTISHPSLSSS